MTGANGEERRQRCFCGAYGRGEYVIDGRRVTSSMRCESCTAEAMRAIWAVDPEAGTPAGWSQSRINHEMERRQNGQRSA